MASSHFIKADRSRPVASVDTSPSTSDQSDGNLLAKRVAEFLKRLKSLQDRMHNANPIKARSKHRLVYGLREVGRDARNGLITAIFLAENVECPTDAKCLTADVAALERECAVQGIPLIRSLSRRAIGRILKKGGQIAVVGVSDIRGCEV
jgi:selenocysteine insertion sequence-binding protein 2